MRSVQQKVMGGLALLFCAIFFGVWYWYFLRDNKEIVSENVAKLLPDIVERKSDLQTFRSAEEMREYMARGENRFTAPMSSPMFFESTSVSDVAFSGNPIMKSFEGGGGTPSVSQTNVQVPGIDEPDIVKTDGESLYISRESYSMSDVFYEENSISSREFLEENPSEIPMPDMLPPAFERGSIRVADVSGEGSKGFSEIGKIMNRSGNLLLDDEMLAVFETEGIFGYTVANPNNPQEAWSLELKGGAIMDARTYHGDIYFVERNFIQRDLPCPFVPIAYAKGGEEVRVDCLDISHPVYPVPSQSVYTLMRADFKTGKILEKRAIIGGDEMQMAFFEGGWYIWYQEEESVLDTMYDFFRSNNTLISQSFFLRLEKLREYDISDGSKTQELFYELEKYKQSLNGDDRLKFENDVRTAMSRYLEEHKRDIVKTRIFRLHPETFAIEESGVVPGRIKNQFSVDEYEGNLRVSTTTASWSSYLGQQMKEENDVYVLNNRLNIRGSVQGLGKGETIYSTRFLGDRGYVVTFKQTDPFFVLDLSDPDGPKLSGELKIPGYSSYLHPLGKNRVLGIGKENNEVKASLFDVSDPDNPKELSMILLDEYWSDILNTHHAFTVHEGEEVFFLPGSKGGYIVSYADDTLKLVKAINGNQTKRAVYVDDRWYIVSRDGVALYSGKTWLREGDIVFRDNR